MKITKKTILIGVSAAAIGVSAAYMYSFTKDRPPVPPVTQAPLPEHDKTGRSQPLADLAVETPSPPSPATNSNTQAVGQPPSTDGTLEGPVIDPVRLAEAELALVNNQIYEDVARDTLPILSLQTHNPVWQLEYEASHPELADDATTARQQGPLPAPESGEFGNIQPPEGEIWLRIPVDYSTEHLDIMAQNADLYRTETGYSGTVTVTLWVGGRVYSRQHYE